MKEFISKNFIYVLFSIVIILIFVSFFYVSLTEKGKNQGEVNQPVPQNLGPQPGKNYSAETEQNVKDREKSQLVSKLTGQLPYKSKNFYFEYFYSNYVYQLTLYKGKEDLGQKEFDLYLKDNNVERSWLQRLVIKVY